MRFLRSEKKLPLIGVRGAGKTYFLFSLGYLVSQRGWGHVRNPSGEDPYLDRLLTHVSEGTPFPPTMEQHPVTIEIESLPGREPGETSSFTVSTEDFSGGQFENAMTTNAPDPVPSEGPRSEFFELYQGCDGLIVIVDLVQGVSQKEFQSDKEAHILEALSNQVEPLIEGLNLALDANQGLDGKPIFFIFSKQDIHGLTVDEISAYFDRIMMIPLRRLEANGCHIGKYTVSAVGWTDGELQQQLRSLEKRGFSEILRDMGVVFD